MRNMMIRMAFAILRRYDAKLWWNTADVPGLFGKAMGSRVVFKFATMRFHSLDKTAKLATGDDDGFNFSHPWPPDPPE